MNNTFGFLGLQFGGPLGWIVGNGMDKKKTLEDSEESEKQSNNNEKKEKS